MHDEHLFWMLHLFQVSANVPNFWQKKGVIMYLIVYRIVPKQMVQTVESDYSTKTDGSDGQAWMHNEASILLYDRTQ